MIYFNNDYSEGCHPEILKALAQTNLEQSSGYGTDGHCAAAAAKIRAICRTILWRSTSWWGAPRPT